MLLLIRHAATRQPMLRPPGDLTPATREEWVLDFDLSERGEAEARELGEWLSRMPAPDLVLASPRKRTQQTLALARPDLAFTVDERLHEWHEEERCEALQERARAMLALGEDQTVWAFTHGGFIRAVVAALLVNSDAGRFAATFHDLRRTLHVWNASVTVVGHGGSGLELLAVNACPAIDRLLGH